MPKRKSLRALAAVVLVAAAAPGAARAAGGDLIVADEGSGTVPGKVVVVTPGTGAQRVLASGGPFDGNVRVAREASGNYVVVDYAAYGSGAVFRVDRNTGATTTVSSGGSFDNPFDLAVDRDGTILVVDAGVLAVFRVNPVTGAQTTVSSGGSFANPVGIALERDGKIIVADNSVNKLFRVNPATGAQTVVAEGGNFANAAGVAIAPNGTIFVVDSSAFGTTGAIIRVNPSTGAQTRVTSGGLEGAIGVAVRPDGLLFVTNAVPGGDMTADGQVLAVSSASGNRSLVAQGGNLVNPEGLTILPNTPPVASVASRAVVRAGRPVTFDASASRDPDGSIVRYQWDLDGDGTFETATGSTPRATRTYEAEAALSVGVRVTDSGLTAATATRAFRVDGTRPKVSRASVTPKRFRVDRGAKAAAKRRAQKGTRFKYRLSEVARVRFRVSRRGVGIRFGKRCLAPGARRGPRCVRYVRIGSFSQRGKAGANTRRFSGKLRGKALRPGRYRARVVATDRAGNASRARTLSFRVVRR